MPEALLNGHVYFDMGSTGTPLGQAFWEGQERTGNPISGALKISEAISMKNLHKPSF